MTVRLVSVVAVVLSTCVWSGCGPSDPYGRQEVSGKVLLNGQPVQYGSVQFAPTAGSPVRTGAVIKDGAYYVPRDKGLPPGEYIVQIAVPDPNDNSDFKAGPRPRANLAPPEWGGASQHKITVTKGSANQFDFDMKSQ